MFPIVYSFIFNNKQTKSMNENIWLKYLMTQCLIIYLVAVLMLHTGIIQSCEYHWYHAGRRIPMLVFCSHIHMNTIGISCNLHSLLIFLTTHQYLILHSSLFSMSCFYQMFVFVLFIIISEVNLCIVYLTVFILNFMCALVV